MTVKKWLKIILFFPAMFMLGIPDVGAEPVTDPAEDLDNQGEDDTGAEPDDQAAELDGEEADKTTSQETDEETAEVKKPQEAHQTTLEERANQIAEKTLAKWREEQAEITRQATARIEADKKPFVDLTPEQSNQINSDYLSAVTRKVELEEAIRLGDHEADTILALRQTEKWIRDTEAWFSDNESKKAEWTKKQGETTRQQAEAAERAQRLETTANVYREQHKIPADVWETSSQWFSEQLKTDKVLGLRFSDAYRLHGDVGAVEFAHKYCTENMGKTAEDALKQKEKAKLTLAPGVTAQGKTTAPDLKALLKAAQKSGSEEDYLAFSAAKRAATK
jgi:hypothetical protein